MHLQTPIFVTGGTGFLGSHLLRALVNQGFTNVKALKRETSPTQLVKDFAERIQWLDGDILDTLQLEKHLEGIQQVYHCAAMVSFHKKDASAMRRINEEGTANVVNACIAAGVEKLVHVSSIAAIGRSRKSDQVDESTQWESSPLNTEYAISKYLAEMQVWRGREEGLNAAIVNPSLILGPGFPDQGTAAIFSKFKKGFPFYPDGKTGVVDVKDVADYMVLLMNSEVEGERIILNGTNISYKDLFGKIAIAYGQKPPRMLLQSWMTSIAWRLAGIWSLLSGTTPLLTKETARTTASTFYYDNHKSTQLINFTYRPLDQTIEETANAI